MNRLAISIPPGVVRLVQLPPGKTDMPGAGNLCSTNVPDVYCSNRTLSAASVKITCAPNANDVANNSKIAIINLNDFMLITSKMCTSWKNAIPITWPIKTPYATGFWRALSLKHGHHKSKIISGTKGNTFGSAPEFTVWVIVLEVIEL